MRRCVRGRLEAGDLSACRIGLLHVLRGNMLGGFVGGFCRAVKRKKEIGKVVYADSSSPSYHQAGLPSGTPRTPRNASPGANQTGIAATLASFEQPHLRRHSRRSQHMCSSPKFTYCSLCAAKKPWNSLYRQPPHRCRVRSCLFRFSHIMNRSSGNSRANMDIKETTARLRRTFHYPTDDSSSNGGGTPEVLDEEGEPKTVYLLR